MSRAKLQYVDEIIGRLQQFVGVETDAALAEKLGLSRSAISVWRMRGSLDIPLVLTKCDGINLHWLITGTGDPSEPGSQSVVSNAEMELVRRLKSMDVDVAETLSMLLEVAVLAKEKGYSVELEESPMMISLRKRKSASTKSDSINSRKRKEA